MDDGTYFRHFQHSINKNNEKIEIFIELCYIYDYTCLKPIRNLVLKEWQHVKTWYCNSPRTSLRSSIWKGKSKSVTLVNVISVHAFKLLKYMTVKQKLNHIALIWLKPQHTKTIDKQIYRLYLPVYLLRCQYCIPSMYNGIIVSSCWDFAVSNAIMTTKNNNQVAQRLIKMPKNARSS